MSSQMPDLSFRMNNCIDAANNKQTSLRFSTYPLVKLQHRLVLNRGFSMHIIPLELPNAMFLLFRHIHLLHSRCDWIPIASRSVDIDWPGLPAVINRQNKAHCRSSLPLFSEPAFYVNRRRSFLQAQRLKLYICPAHFQLQRLTSHCLRLVCPRHDDPGPALLCDSVCR